MHASPASAEPSSPPNPSAAVHWVDLAGVPRRLLGFAIDWGLAYLIAWAFFGADRWAIAGIWALMQITLVGTVGFAFGHLITATRVVRLSDGQPCGFVPAVVRTLALALFIPGLIWGKDGRPGHDRIAGTAVVRSSAVRRG